MPNDYIELHPEKGVNPRMMTEVCRLCGKEEDAGIVLLGRGDRKTRCPSCGAMCWGGFDRETAHSDPRLNRYKCPACGARQDARYGADASPIGEHEKLVQAGVCKSCEGYMKQGVVFAEVAEAPGGATMPRGRVPKLTGRFCVIRDDGVGRMPLNAEVKERILRERAAYLPKEAWEMLGLPSGEQEQGAAGEETEPQTGDAS